MFGFSAAPTGGLWSVLIESELAERGMWRGSRAWDTYPVRRLTSAAFITEQSVLSVTHVRHIIDSSRTVGDRYDEPYALAYGRFLVLRDGHHRVAAGTITGDGCDVRIIPLPQLAAAGHLADCVEFYAMAVDRIQTLLAPDADGHPRLVAGMDITDLDRRFINFGGDRDGVPFIDRDLESEIVSARRAQHDADGVVRPEYPAGMSVWVLPADWFGEDSRIDAGTVANLSPAGNTGWVDVTVGYTTTAVHIDRVFGVYDAAEREMQVRRGLRAEMIAAATARIVAEFNRQQQS